MSVARILAATSFLLLSAVQAAPKTHCPESAEFHGRLGIQEKTRGIEVLQSKLAATYYTGTLVRFSDGCEIWFEKADFNIRRLEDFFPPDPVDILASDILKGPLLDEVRPKLEKAIAVCDNRRSQFPKELADLSVLECRSSEAKKVLRHGAVVTLFFERDGASGDPGQVVLHLFSFGGGYMGQVGPVVWP